MSEPPRPNRARYVWHVVSVAGHDREGAEPFPVARLRLIRLLDEVLDLFDTEPRFRHFTLDGQSILLEDYLSVRPENFERVEKAVQEGKLLVGPWYVMPESSLVSIESLIRNLMIGLRTARVFGPPMLVGYLPDAQTLPGYLPQILKGFGIEAVIISWQADDQPTEMIWAGDDGTQIMVGSLSNIESELVHWREKLAPYSESGHLLLSHHWNMRATRQQRLDILNALPAAQVELRDDVFSSSMAAYARAIETFARTNPLPAKQPDQADEQNISRAGNAMRHRSAVAERLLTQVVEPSLVWAENEPSDNREWQIQRPQMLIQQLWRLLLQDQYAPFLCGTAANPHLRTAWRSDYIRETANSLLNSSSLDIRPDQPFLDRVIQSSESGFRVGAVKLPEDSDRIGMIVRGRNITDEPLWVTLTPWRAFSMVDVVTLNEEPTGGKLAVEANGAIQFKAAPHRILTFWFHD